MAESKCGICDESYNLGDNKAKRILCGHVYCESCVKAGILSKNVFSCPLNCGNDNRDLDGIPYDRTIMEIVERNSLYCYVHSMVATGYDPSNQSPICPGCRQNAPVEPNSFNLVIPKDLHRVYLKYKPWLSKELKTIVKLHTGAVLRDEVSFMEMIKKSCEMKNSCSTHPNMPCTKFDTNTFLLLCDQCQSENSWEINGTNSSDPD